MDAADAGVRAELGQLNVGALRARAQADSVDAALIEVARDGDDPKAELTDLIVRRAAAVRARSAFDALRAKLATQNVGQLRKRAAAAEAVTL